MRVAITMIMLCFLLQGMVVQADAADQKKVLVIESYHADYDWDVSYMRGIRRALNGTAEVLSFQMNTKRLPREQFQARADEAYAYAEQVRPDLVMLGDDNAVSLLGRRFVKAGMPIVYLGVNGNPRNYGLHNQPNVLGVLERPLVQRSIMLLGNLSPSIREVLVLFDDSTTSHEVAYTMLNGETQFTLYGIACEMVRATFYENWQELVMESASRGYDAILLGTYHTLLDRDGKVVDEEEVIHWANEHSPVPLFGLWDFTIGRGKAAAGFMLRGEDQGYAAGQLVLSFFNGTHQTQKPMTIEPTLVFSRYEIDRWKLSADELRRWNIVWVD